ncbi:MAG: 5-dehydro-2-deoxygluconokinase [Anaerolineae bacterium]|nr:5-dehydro-2-deoxygluconokinase [Anaerolineae bacterium]
MSQAIKYDLLSMGRACIDLYADEIGVSFPDIKHFSAYVGGCPANIAVGTRRLGLRVAMLSAVGQDLVGEFVLQFLAGEGVETRYVPAKPGYRTGAAALAIEPPDHFPLVYYRDNAADIQLDIDDVLATPIAHSRILLVSGTGLSRDPSRCATILALERARAAGVRTFIDLDLRTDQWADPRAYGVTMRSVLPLLDVVIGTEDEIKAVILQDVAQMSVVDSQVSSADVGGDLDAAIETILGYGPQLLAVKRGRQGAWVFERGHKIDVPGFPVEIYNTLGAGDAFASGFIYGTLQGWDPFKSARLGNAVGAIVVTRHACANSMPTMDEVMDFIGERGGF